MDFAKLQTTKTLENPSKKLGAPEGSHPGHRQVGPGGRAAPPGRVKAKACLDPAPGRTHARGAHTRRGRRTAARRSEAGAGQGRRARG